MRDTDGHCEGVCQSSSIKKGDCRISLPILLGVLLAILLTILLLLLAVLLIVFSSIWRLLSVLEAALLGWAIRMWRLTSIRRRRLRVIVLLVRVLALLLPLPLRRVLLLAVWRLLLVLTVLVVWV